MQEEEGEVMHCERLIEGRTNQELEKLWKEGNVQVLVPVVPFVINQISEGFWGVSNPFFLQVGGC